VVARLLELMREAKGRGADLVVYPELALTTFFPRWWMEDEAEIDAWYEREMPSPATRPLFEAAREKGVGFYLG
jgi:predicted amidohydrolase